MIRCQKTKRICFIVEGETEKALLEALEIQGKKHIFNLWNNEIKKIFPRLRMDILFIIYDTDCTDNYIRFGKNLSFLSKNRIKFFLLQQTNNLEDELIRCLTKCNKIEDFFGCTLTEFKEKFISCNNLKKKLDELGLNCNSLWGGDQNSKLPEWEKYRGSYDQVKPT